MRYPPSMSKFEWLIALIGLALGGVLCAEDCDSTEIMKCLTSLSQSADRERLFFPDTPQKLREYCKHLMAGMDCANNIIDKCTTHDDKQMYQNLTQDMIGMNVALCTQGSPLSTRFLKHVGCYKSLTERFRGCTDRYIGNIIVVHGLSQDEQIRMTCCTVHEYSRCMKNVVEGRCEKEAQELVEETVLKALTTSFRYCNQLGGIPTTNCRKMFQTNQGHATGGLDNNGAFSLRLSPMLFLVVVLLTVVSVAFNR